MILTPGEEQQRKALIVNKGERMKDTGGIFVKDDSEWWNTIDIQQADHTGIRIQTTEECSLDLTQIHRVLF